jgi:branched-chain amino acid transport system ATP-binding protein
VPILLRFDELCIRFGGVNAVDGVSFAVAQGEICGLIGPNGAGKTTLFNCVSGLYPIESGDIDFNGRSLKPLPPHKRAALGIARTFQNLALFTSQSVLFNVLCGVHPRMRTGLFAHVFGHRAVAREEAWALEQAKALLARLGLEPLASRKVGELSLGMRKRVEIARALAAQPKLLMLDEPASGLSPIELDELAQLIASLRSQEGLTVLLVEHRLRWVQAVCDRVVALNFGRVIADGTPNEVSAHPEVVAAWLGRPH